MIALPGAIRRTSLDASALSPRKKRANTKYPIPIMKYHSVLCLSFCCLSIMALSATRSHANISMTAQEVGNDVVFSFSGSIDLAGLGDSQTTSSRGAVYPVNAFLEFGPAELVPDSTALYLSSVVTAESSENFGPGSFVVPTSSEGSPFSVNNNSIKLPLGYASGASVSGSMTFAEKSLADLQVAKSDTPYVWVLTNGQKINLTILDAGDDNSDEIAELTQKIKKVKRELRRAKARDQKSRVKKLRKRLRWLKSKLERL